MRHPLWMMWGRIVPILTSLNRTFSRKRRNTTSSNPLQKRKLLRATREAGTSKAPALLIGKMNSVTTRGIRLSLTNLHTAVKMIMMIIKAHHLLTRRSTKGVILVNQIRTTDISLPPTWWADAFTALVGETLGSSLINA